MGTINPNSNFLTGRKAQTIKKYAVDEIVSVDVWQSMLTINFEIVLVGVSDSGNKRSNLLINAFNENVTTFSKDQAQQVQYVARVIRDLQEWRKKDRTQPQPVEVKNSIPEQIKLLASLKDDGIISNEEFEEKKKELLSRMCFYVARPPNKSFEPTASQQVFYRQLVRCGVVCAAAQFRRSGASV